MMSCFVYQTFSFNESSHNKIMIGEMPSHFIRLTLVMPLLKSTTVWIHLMKFPISKTNLERQILTKCSKWCQSYIQGTHSVWQLKSVLISSPEPKADWWASSVGRPLSSVCVYVCMSTFSNIFSSETTRPIEAKFHIEPPWDGWTKVRSNDSGQMTKIAAIPIYGKNFKNLLLKNQKALNLCTHYWVLECY